MAGARVHGWQRWQRLGSWLAWSALSAWSACSALAGVGGCGGADAGGEPRELAIRITNLTPSESVYAAGTFDTPESAVEAGPLEPGHSYRIDVSVHPGAQLQLITMVLDSNDAFLAFSPGGIALWSHDGQPLAGERTEELVLYDAGTEVNEPLGLGEHQAPRQAEPGAGEAQGGVVRVLADDGGQATDPEGIEFPAIAEFVELHVVHRGGPNFQIVIRNVSPDGLIAQPEQPKLHDGEPVVLSPGVFTVHGAGVELFRVGEPVTPQLERLVEDGDPGPLAVQIDRARGIASDLSAVVWAVHAGGLELCGLGEPASPGLEDLAEDGRSKELLDELAGMASAADAGSGPTVIDWGLAAHRNGSPVIEPGETIRVRVTARPGDRFGFLSGYLAANDKLVGACGAGIPLFDDDGEPRRNELSWAVDLLDAGTELDEPPGLGASQFERQPRSGAGIDENEIVREVRGEWMGWSYPATEQIVSVVIEPVDDAGSEQGGLDADR